MSCHQMLKIAMDSKSIPTSHNYIYFCTLFTSLTTVCQGSFVTKSNNQSSMHLIFTHMYSTVSKGPSYMESPTGFSQACPFQTAFPTFHYRTSSFCFLPTYSSLELKTIEKEIHVLHSWETIPDCRI